MLKRGLRWLSVCGTVSPLVMGRNVVMMKMLAGLIGRIFPAPSSSREHAARKTRPNLTRKSGAADFRAVEIAPSLTCCAAAMQAAGKRHLMLKAPRLPLVGCTMPATCSCMFRKNADRRDNDRRRFGWETNRWFGGVDSRKRGARRSVET
jgi:hypothetical protein